MVRLANGGGLREQAQAARAARQTVAQTERQFQAFVIELATIRGWHHYHAPDNRPDANGRVQRVAPGFPDLVLWKGTRLIFAELKRANGRTTKAQVLTLAQLAETGAEVYLWRPGDDIDAILLRKPPQPYPLPNALGVTLPADVPGVLSEF